MSIHVGIAIAALGADIENVLLALNGHNAAVAGRVGVAGDAGVHVRRGHFFGGVHTKGRSVSHRSVLENLTVLVVGLEAAGCVGWVDFLGQVDVLVGVSKRTAVEVCQPGVALNQIFELGVTDLVTQIEVVQSVKVIETVAVHEPLNLVQEHQVESFTQHAPRHVRLS